MRNLQEVGNFKKYKARTNWAFRGGEGATGERAGAGKLLPLPPLAYNIKLQSTSGKLIINLITHLHETKKENPQLHEIENYFSVYPKLFKEWKQQQSYIQILTPKPPSQKSQREPS